MRLFYAAAVIAFLAGPAYAQSESQSIPRYGEAPKTKSPQELAAEKEAEKAYKRSLGNIPEQKPSDPWGIVRSDSAPKTVAKDPAAKDPAAKRTKAGNTTN
jgi:hypothetical protein